MIHIHYTGFKPVDATVNYTLYAGKLAMAAFCCFLFYDELHLQGGALWAAVSAVVVLQPDPNASIQASITRVLATILGAGLGAVIAILVGRTPLTIAAGILVVGVVGARIHLTDSIRPACASLIIIMVTEGANLVRLSLERVVSVVVGALIALLLNMVIDALYHRLQPWINHWVGEKAQVDQPQPSAGD